MKLLLNIFCWILAIFCIYFPFAYFHSEMDKKEFKISHILVDSKEKAEEIKKEIVNKDKTFAKAAQEYSLCDSKEKKGDIGYSMRGMIFKELEDAALKLDRNVISDPIKTEAGWHIIKVTDIKYFSDSENLAKRY